MGKIDSFLRKSFFPLESGRTFLGEGNRRKAEPCLTSFALQNSQLPFPSTRVFGENSVSSASRGDGLPPQDPAVAVDGGAGAPLPCVRSLKYQYFKKPCVNYSLQKIINLLQCRILGNDPQTMKHYTNALTKRSSLTIRR
ncbi:MAG: hypothetical protein K2I74_05835, partial [Treponemataceae bacterium]|nr:hypothetical protein [Treponemataceae bacterium]